MPHYDRIDANSCQCLDADSLSFSFEAEQDVLGSDALVAELHRFPEGHFQDLLGAGREGW